MRRIITTLICSAFLAALIPARVAAVERSVLRIEEAMRVWQERWLVASGADQIAGLANPNRGRAGVTPAGIFSGPLSWPARLDGQVPGPYPPNCFYESDLTVSNLAASKVIALRGVIQNCLGAAVAPSGAFDHGGVVLRFDPNWDNLDVAGPGGPLRAPDASRMFRVFYNGAWVPPDINVAPWNTIIGGSITINNYEQRFAEIVSFLKLPMRINTYGTQINQSIGMARAWGNNFISPDIYNIACGCVACNSGCQPGVCAFSPDGVNFSINLGQGADGPIGAIQLYSDLPFNGLATPGALSIGLNARVFTGHTGSQIDDGEAYIIMSVVNGANQPRQVYFPQGLADIVADPGSPGYGYTIYFYDKDNRGGFVDGLFSPSPSAAYRTVRVENPDGPSSNNRLRIIEAGSVPMTTNYTYANGAWILQTGSSQTARTESVAKAWAVGNGTSVGDVSHETHELRDGAGQLLTKRLKKYKIFPWNADASGAPLTSRGRQHELIEEIIDPEGTAKTTKYRYDETIESTYALNQSRRRLKQVERWDGTWERYDYDAMGRVEKTYTSFNDTPASLSLTGTPSGDHRVRQTSVSGSTTTTVQAIRSGGVDYVVGRTWVTRTLPSSTLELVVTETATDNASVQGSALNIKSIKRSFRTGIFAGRTEREINADGTVTLYSYGYNSQTGENTITTRSGVPENIVDPMLAIGVVEGTRSVVVSNAQGEVINREMFDIASNLKTDSEVAVRTDSSGRVLERLYNDGRTEMTLYDCCNLAATIDRTGLRTNFFYDNQRRLIGETSYLGTNGTKYSEYLYHYDAAGRRTMTVRRAHGASDSVLTPTQIVQEHTIYDGAGDVISISSPRSTVKIAESIVSGRRVRVMTYSDGGTRIETFDRSGQLILVSGTAVAPIKFEYGVDVLGEYIKEVGIKSDDSLPGNVLVETEFQKKYSDFAGRPLVTVFPDGAKIELQYYAANESIPARRGKLKSVRAPASSLTPGALASRTIYDYNSIGDRNIEAIDINMNDVIDYSGSDRITKAEGSVAVLSRDGVDYIVARKVTSVWGSPGQNLSSPVLVENQSVSGTRSWTVSSGMPESTYVLDYNENGATTQTVVSSDGSKSISSFIGSRKISTQIIASGIQLEKVDYSYDGYGRVQRSTDSRSGRTSIFYENDDLISAITTPDPDATRTGPGYDPQTTSYYYDTMGRRSRTLQPDGTEVFFSYWQNGLLRRTWGAGTLPQEMFYDEQGRLKQVRTFRNFQDESSFESSVDSASTRWHYDSLRGWLSQKTASDNSFVAYQYYPSGLLKSRTWARGVVTNYAYNDAGEVSGITYSDATPPVSGIIYDRLGRRMQLQDAAGTINKVYKEYTSLVESESFVSGVLGGIELTRDYDSLNRPTSISLPTANYGQSITYYDGSRPNTITATLNGFNTTHEYGYLPSSGLVTSLIQKLSGMSALSTIRSHDNLNRLVTVTASPVSSQAVSIGYDFNSVNQRVRAAEINGDAWSYNYDSMGQLKNAEKKTGVLEAIPSHSFTYEFDTLGNRIRAARSGDVSDYSRDASGINRYSNRSVSPTKEIVGSADPSARVLVNFSEAVRQGSLFSKKVVVDNSTSAVWKMVDILANLATGEVVKQSGNIFVPRSPEIYTHDADGNLTDDGRWRYFWDAENRLISQETQSAAVAVGVPRQRLEYTYDAGSRRISKKIYNWSAGSYQLGESILFVYDEWNLLAELNAQSDKAVIRTYAWGIDLSGAFQRAGGVGGLLAVANSSAVYAPVYDGNGNVLGLVNFSTGVQEATYAYGPFGETLMAYGVAASVSPFRFSSKYEDAESGLIYYGLRYYNPSVGRWLNSDPIGEIGGVNTHAFNGNNLIDSIDPLGTTLYVDGKKISAESAVGKMFVKGETSAEIIKQMVRAWEDFEFEDCENLGKHVQFRIDAINLMIGANANRPEIGIGYTRLNSSGFYERGSEPFAPPPYWTVDPAGSYNYIASGSSYEAINSFIKGPTRLECLTAIKAMYLSALATNQGQAKFDKDFPSLTIAPQSGSSAAFKLAEDGNTLVPGDWVYFHNNSNYLKRHKLGYWQGENAMYMGDGRFAGLGVANATVDGMRTELLNAYNKGLPDKQKISLKKIPKQPSNIQRPTDFTKK